MENFEELLANLQCCKCGQLNRPFEAHYFEGCGHFTCDTCCTADRSCSKNCPEVGVAKPLDKNTLLLEAYTISLEILECCGLYDPNKPTHRRETGPINEKIPDEPSQRTRRISSRKQANTEATTNEVTREKKINPKVKKSSDKKMKSREQVDYSALGDGCDVNENVDHKSNGSEELSVDKLPSKEVSEALLNWEARPVRKGKGKVRGIVNESVIESSEPVFNDCEFDDVQGDRQSQEKKRRISRMTDVSVVLKKLESFASSNDCIESKQQQNETMRQVTESSSKKITARKTKKAADDGVLVDKTVVVENVGDDEFTQVTEAKNAQNDNEKEVPRKRHLRSKKVQQEEEHEQLHSGPDLVVHTVDDERPNQNDGNEKFKQVPETQNAQNDNEKEFPKKRHLRSKKVQEEDGHEQLSLGPDLVVHAENDDEPKQKDRNEKFKQVPETQNAQNDNEKEFPKRRQLRSKKIRQENEHEQLFSGPDLVVHTVDNRPQEKTRRKPVLQKSDLTEKMTASRKNATQDQLEHIEVSTGPSSETAAFHSDDIFQTLWETFQKVCEPDYTYHVPQRVDRKLGRRRSQRKNADKLNAKGETNLHRAVHQKNRTKVVDLLNEGANPNIADYAGWTPLHDAVAKAKDASIVKVLLEHGARPDAYGLDNQTPLHLAVEARNYEIMKMLLDYGADPSAPDLHGYSPRDIGADDLKAMMILSSTGQVTLKSPPKLQSHPLLLYIYSMPTAQCNIVKKFAAHFVLRETNDIYVASHVVVPSLESCSNFDWTLSQVMARGSYICPVTWCEDSMKAGKILDESKHHLELPWMPGWTRARENAERCGPGLFSGCHILLNIPNNTKQQVIGGTVDIAQLRTFIKKTGGELLKRMPDPESPHNPQTLPYHAVGSMSKCSQIVVFVPRENDRSIKYNMEHLKCLPLQWLIDCILRFKLEPLSSTIGSE